ncbi:hypothetical protein H2198_010139 [Neophaeococcomyces mojaviensis]|uniref:Uncharacterized protein n=1 Tax=Neophaeococcomyces mojaviensis TaxID=3383035 RepID=A0ACC2ZSK4_9EURO|nr:hypothetical protein H2198_010139 [Knufia sp. JES_112]
MPSRQRDGRPAPPRRFSSHLRQHRQSSSAQGGYGTFPSTLPHRSSELENLLEEQHHESDEHADSDGLYPPHCCYTADHSPRAGTDLYGHDQWPVYQNIHKIRHEVINSVDDPYSLDQLKAPRMNISVVRPLVDQFYKTQDLSIVYCLLVNRTQFIREQSYATHHQTVNLTRALLCEIVAEKILRRYNEDNPGPKGLLKLANIIVAGFEPFQNAPDDVFKNNYHILNYVRQKGGKQERKMTALEVAIVSESKSFLSSSACQKVVDAIYRGKLVYTPNSFIDILPDYWKRRPTSLYDPRRGPILNQYRLVVPRTRNVIEISQFLILLVLYLIVMDGRETRMTTKYTPIEAAFQVYTWGWILDQLASVLEHGWQVYTQNLWSFLDVIFAALFTFYFIVRMHATACTDHEEAIEWARLALDALSCAAPILIPRLAFNILSENLVFLCLRDMLSNFITLVFLASWCFIGFLLTLKWLHNGLHAPVTIGKWMIWIWFGLDGTGIDKAPEFHWLLGPVVMIMFAFLGNTLFVTILVSMLSNTFSIISANAVQEMHFRRSVLTFEGVKADAIFYYMPPFNLLALLFLLPLKFVLTPRWFHKVNVFAAKSVNAPLLALISLYERKTLWVSSKYRSMKPKHIDWRNQNGPSAAGVGWWSRTFQFWDLSRLSVHGDLQAVFDEVPATTAEDDEHDEGIGKILREDFLKQFTKKSPTLPQNGVKRAVTEGSRSNSMPTLKQDFPDDSDENGDDESYGAPKGYKKIQPRARKDSIMELGDGGSVDLTEANARLHKLEESVQRIEALLVQLVGDGDGIGEGGDEVEEAAEDIAEGIDPAAE